MSQQSLFPLAGYLLSFFVLTLLAGPDRAQALEERIIFPPDQSSLTVDEVRVVGTTTPQRSQVSLRVEGPGGTKLYQVAVEKEAFQLALALQRGKTIVTLLDKGQQPIQQVRLYVGDAGTPDEARPYYLHSKGELTENCTGCHLIVLRQKPNYRHIEQKVGCVTGQCHQTFGTKEYVHGPLEEGDCVSCHNPHGTTTKNYLARRKAELCYRCHTTERDRFSKGVVHFPVGRGECLSCHDPHQSDQEFHLQRDNVQELCAGCHGYVLLKHKYMHEPVESEGCIACHNPHSSRYPNLLYEKGRDVCLLCHKVRKEEFGRRHVHKPVQKDCTLCHDPHGSETVFHLRTRRDNKGRYIIDQQPLKESCMACHAEVNPELARALETSKYTHKPVAEGKCVVCHTPHSTNYRKQLVKDTPELCYDCHEKMKKHIVASRFRHGPVRKGDCAQCHLVHGSDYKHLLRNGLSDKLYADYDPSTFALCLDCHNGKVFEEEQSLETGFRNGTRNLHYEHVHRDKKGRNCNTCHEVHASDQEKHIRAKIPYRGRYSISLTFTPSKSGGTCVVGCHKPRKYDRDNPVAY